MALGEKTVTFKCEADGKPPLQYSWTFNGEIMHGKAENVLEINDVNKKMAGKYQCCVKNRFDHVISNPADLRIGTCNRCAC